MATWTVKVDTKSLENAVSDIGTYLEEVGLRIARRLAEEVAKPIAQQEYGFGGAVIVSTRKTTKGYAVDADGEAVCFIEFGTGVYANAYHPLAGQAPFTVRAGSWSDTHARTWRHYLANHPEDPRGEHYPYNTQRRMGMYEAYKAILQEIDRIAREELDS